MFTHKNYLMLPTVEKYNNFFPQKAQPAWTPVSSACTSAPSPFLYYICFITLSSITGASSPFPLSQVLHHPFLYYRCLNLLIKLIKQKKKDQVSLHLPPANRMDEWKPIKYSVRSRCFKILRQIWSNISQITPYEVGVLDTQSPKGWRNTDSMHGLIMQGSETYYEKFRGFKADFSYDTGCS